jgi:hypothetical protein
MIKVDLSLQRPDNRVEYELWYASMLDLPKVMLAQLGEYQKPFGKDALFTPRILTFSCLNCPAYIRQNDCISDGLYCPYRGSTETELDSDSDMHASTDRFGN